MINNPTPTPKRPLVILKEHALEIWIASRVNKNAAFRAHMRLVAILQKQKQNVVGN
jgi:hypothetical protein